MSLENKRVVLTGKMSRQRNIIVRDIGRAGGIVEDTVDYNVSYLVLGQMPGRQTVKYRRAQQLGTEIISESQLYDIIRDFRRQEVDVQEQAKITQDGGLDLTSFFEE